MDRKGVEHLTTEELAARLRIPLWSVQDKAAHGLLPAFKVGRQWRFRLVDVERWEEAQVEQAREDAERRRGRG